MKHITFYFDVISPYAYLAFERLPEALVGLNYSVTYCPVLFAGLLKHHGQLGPAEIEPKRSWTYRQVQWLADDMGIEMQMPAAHPFNPLALQRLAVANNTEGFPNRFVVEKLFRHVWCGGQEATDQQRLQALADSLNTSLKPSTDPNSAAVKDLLKAHTHTAISRGVFGVPTLEVDGKLFFGLDALPMLAAYLRGDTSFFKSAWNDVEKIPMGTSRKK